MPKVIHLREWGHLFLTGKTKGVYLALISFVIFCILILYNRKFLVDFIGVEVGAFASFGVLVDLVSHLFSDQFESNLNMSEWIFRVRHGRTHDVYGIFVQVGASFFALNRFQYVIILWVVLALEFYYIARSRFYH
ncbi:MAG: hypothetical protein M1454_04025 [Candidatus Thermoplasmatota archaeon]|nr:hypothetical protein [Candidatus Thermoplasmatota archaeon]